MENTTLLVTTDFSANSKAGIRFAIQLAMQMPCKLVFYHVIELMTPTGWLKEDGEQFVETETQKAEHELNQFLDPFLKETKTLNVIEMVVEMGMDVDNFIIEYAKKINADFICMSTHGAGLLQKLIGTNASILVSTSPIPMIVVPHAYRVKPVTKIGYPSDFNNLDSELKIVNQLATYLDATVDVYHYDYAVHETHTAEEFNIIKDLYQSNTVFFHTPVICIDYSLVENIQRAIKKEKPSVLVMFTKQKEHWIDRFFFESKTANMSFDIKIPLISFKK